MVNEWGKCSSLEIMKTSVLIFLGRGFKTNATSEEDDDIVEDSSLEC